MYNWTIINTSHNNNFPHKEYLYKHNPKAQIIFADIKSSLSPKNGYYNSDRLIRNWLKNNYSSIINTNVAIFEWDTLCNMELPTTIKLDNEIMVRNSIPYNNNKDWYWFKYKTNLGEFSDFVHGLQPLGVLLIDRNSLKKILDTKFDAIFNQHIFSELRFPTVANYLGIKIRQIIDTRFKYVTTRPPYNQTNIIPYTGIYHPVKERILLCP